MKLWLLKAREDLGKEDDPWEPWYDKAFGFVIRAETEGEARKIADSDAGNENIGWVGGHLVDKHPWLSSKYSICKELLADGELGSILKDFAAA